MIPIEARSLARNGTESGTLRGASGLLQRESIQITVEEYVHVGRHRHGEASTTQDAYDRVAVLHRCQVGSRLPGVRSPRSVAADCSSISP